jgi:hypothetical protein
MGEEIAQALKNAGHLVFFDRESLPASADYNDRIRTAIAGSDRLVFLASKDSLAPGRFTLTELQFAKEHWPVPSGKVLPVIVDTDLKPSDLPVYLRSVSVMDVSGNATAEVVAAVDKTRKTGWFCKTVSGLTGLATAAGLAWFALGAPTIRSATNVALLPIQDIHFRSAGDPPFPTNAPGASTVWTNTPVSVTIAPVAYVHRTEPGKRARILSERVELQFGDKSLPFKALYVVEITDDRCGDKWFCIKSNAGPETLEPGKTITRETMFHTDSGAPLLWRDFVDSILTRKDLTVRVVFSTRIETAESGASGPAEIVQTCGIDVAQLRMGMTENGFNVTDPIKPVYLQGKCIATPNPKTTALN